MIFLDSGLSCRTCSIFDIALYNNYMYCSPYVKADLANRSLCMVLYVRQQVLYALDLWRGSLLTAKM